MANTHSKKDTCRIGSKLHAKCIFYLAFFIIIISFLVLFESLIIIMENSFWKNDINPVIINKSIKLAMLSVVVQCISFLVCVSQFSKAMHGYRFEIDGSTLICNHNNEACIYLHRFSAKIKREEKILTMTDASGRKKQKNMLTIDDGHNIVTVFYSNEEAYKLFDFLNKAIPW